MVRRWAWGISTAVCLAVGGAANAGDPPDDAVPPPQDSGNVAFHKWNGGPLEKAKPPAPPVDKAAEARTKDAAAAWRAQAEADLLRRLNACDTLRKFALQNGDEKLEKTATDLEEKAKAAYNLRIQNIENGKFTTSVVVSNTGGPKR